MDDSEIDRNLDFQRAMTYLESDTPQARMFLLWRLTRTWPIRYPREERLIPWWRGIENLIGATT